MGGRRLIALLRGANDRCASAAFDSMGDVRHVTRSTDAGF
jgi:hypothetical protein